MKILRSIYEVADFVGCKFWEVEQQFEPYAGHSYCVINDIELQQVYITDKQLLTYVYVDLEDEKDCWLFLMTYIVKNPNYVWKVYVDDYEKWQYCKVINIDNLGMEIKRATVLCESGTQVNRWVKYIFDEEDEDMIPDRCIYYYEK